MHRMHMTQIISTSYKAKCVAFQGWNQKNIYLVVPRHMLRSYSGRSYPILPQYIPTTDVSMFPKTGRCKGPWVLRTSESLE